MEAPIESGLGPPSPWHATTGHVGGINLFSAQRRTPKAFHPKAQGCRAAATLGKSATASPTPTGLRQRSGSVTTQSFSVVYLHLAFSTKERCPYLRDMICQNGTSVSTRGRNPFRVDDFNLSV